MQWKDNAMLEFHSGSSSAVVETILSEIAFCSSKTLTNIKHK